MSVKGKARDVMGGAVGERLRGGRPGALQAAAGAAVAGGVTGVVVFRLLRGTNDERLKQPGRDQEVQMPDIEKLGKEAKKTVKRAASDGPLSKPAGMAVAGAALAAIPFAVEKLGSVRRAEDLGEGERGREQGDFTTQGRRLRRHAEPRVTRSGEIL